MQTIERPALLEQEMPQGQEQKLETPDPMTEALGIIAVVASIKHGMDILGVPDTNGNISGDMSRSEVYHQANKEPGNTTEQLDVAESFMRQRRSVLLEFLGVDEQTQQELAPIINKFELNDGSNPYDALEHILIGDLDHKPESIGRNGEVVPAHVETGGMHFEPSSKQVITEREILRDKTKRDVKGVAAQRGVRKYAVKLDGYDKQASSVFPDTITPAGETEARPATAVDVIRWIQHADADETAQLVPSIRDGGKLVAYVKESRDPSPGGMDVCLIYNPDGQIRSAWPINK